MFDPLAVLLLVSSNISFAEYNEKRKRALARKRKQLEKQNEGKVKTTVTEEPNGMKKITKQQGNVSMEYYE